MSEEAEVIANPNDDSSVTMLDVLEEENELEANVHAVLGACDENNCTYNKGYIRQALYACKTCCVNGSRAAVCLACSLHCHEGHDLVELYTKRNVKCDCGNSKFGDKSCSLEPSKAPLNDGNKYNHNYDGVYCICARPYPDPENHENDNEEMLQCVICEDWFHGKHLEAKQPVPKDEDYSDMICNWCMDKHPFLWQYASEYSVEKCQKKDSSLQQDSGEDLKVNTEKCTLPQKDSSETQEKGACFWVGGWRLALCRCSNCKKLYEEQNLLFLLDTLDSMEAYEEAGKANSEPTIVKGMKALASLGHVEQINAIEGYNDMKESLKEYLKKFVENKKTVRPEDITEFFTQLGAKKRPKLMTPSFCR